MEYFVMLFTQRGDYLPLLEYENSLAKFESEEEAREAALENVLGKHFGYEIFRIGDGIS